MGRRNIKTKVMALVLLVVCVLGVSGTGLASERIGIPARLTGGDRTETSFEVDIDRLNAILANAYQAQRYNPTWTSQLVSFRFGQTEIQHHTNGELYYPPQGKKRDRTAADAVLEFNRSVRYDGIIDVETLKYRLNDVLNAMHDTEKATNAPLIDFDRLYSTRFLTTVRVSSEEGQPMWSLPEEGFTPISYAVRPFIFRDTPDSILEESVYLFVYIVTGPVDVGWLIADKDVVDAVVSVISGDPQIKAVWLEQTPPAEVRPVTVDASRAIGRVTVTYDKGVNVRAGGGTEYAVITTVLPGQSFDCVGQTDTGWYVIFLEDGTAACISPKMVRFTPNA